MLEITNEEAEAGHRFHSVWLRKAVPRWSDCKLIAYDDVGTLTINAFSLRFKGRKNDLLIMGIDLVTYGCQGRDFINPWIKVDHDRDKTALFADGGWLGWRGHLGGTRKILKSIESTYQW
jgi:hypothetical protein